MKRRRSFRLVLAAVGLAFLALYLWALQGRGTLGPDGLPPAPPRAPRAFPGVVLAGGRPAADAAVELFEDAADGFVARTRTAEDGTFVLRWEPTATWDAERLFLAASSPGFARTVAPARARGTEILLARPTGVEGRVVRPDGAPVPGVAVACAVRHDAPGPCAVARTDADGRFAVADLPDGAPLDLLVDGRMLDRRFRAGDALTLHLDRAAEVTFAVRTREGAPVPGARVHLPLPRALAPHARPFETDAEGRAVVTGSIAGGAFLAVDADGYLPLEVAVWPGQLVEVALWPARPVDVRVRDGWSRREVEGATFEIGPAWEQLGHVMRRYPERPGAGAGRYRLSLPPCVVSLRVAAPGYAHERVRVRADARSATVSLSPPRRSSATLVLRAAPGTPDLPVLVVDPEGGWLQRAVLENGRAEVEVPPDLELQLGSAHAAEGKWVHKHDVRPLRPGERRVVAVGARPAVRITIDVDPPVTGMATLADEAHAKRLPPRRIEIVQGRAELWAPPARKLRLAFQPPGNWFEVESELETEHEDRTWKIHLQRSAGVSASFRDRGGNALPFATLRLWEPGPGGRMELRLDPKTARANASGEVALTGLRQGRAAFEVSAPGFRTHRAADLRLVTGEIVDLGVLALEPATELPGTVLGPGGEPVADVHVRVLTPRVKPVPMPGGGEREVYDLQRTGLGDAVTGPDGRFVVQDEAPRDPLVAFHPSHESGLADVALPVGESYRLARLARVALDAPGSIEGVYVLVPPNAAVLVKTDPPMSLRPLPLVLPSGRVSLYVRLRDGRWAAPIVDLEPGQTSHVSPEYLR